MPKPACPSCRCFYRPKTNGFAFVEGMPNGSANPDANIRGNRAPGAWQPYKLWLGDLWECPDCLAQVIVGTGCGPVAEHYQPEFKTAVAHYGATVQVNDC